MTKVKLASFSTGYFNKGAGIVKTALWYFGNALFVRTSWNLFRKQKIWLLRLSSMPYCYAPIAIENGAWIDANTTVCAGVILHENAILTVGLMTSKNLDANGIYQGVPAVKIREREVKQ